MKSPGSREGRERLLLGIVALLLLGSVLTAVAHWIATPHRVCALHGHLEHGQEVASEATHAEPKGPSVRPLDAAHVDCEFGPLVGTEELALPDSKARGALQAPGAMLRPFPPDKQLPESARYRLAPSRSPPALQS